MSQRSEEYTSVEVVKDLHSMKTKQRRKEAIYTGTRSLLGPRGVTYLSPSDYPRSHGTLRGSLYSLSTEGTPPYKFSKIFPNDPPNSESSFHAFFITTLIKFLNKS